MFTLASVVPWGRSYGEYVRMFALTEADLAGRVLGAGDGPASFNAEASTRGTQVVSFDPIYQFSAAQLRRRIDDTAIEVLEQARRNADEFVWNEAIPDIDTLKDVRLSAMATFLEDFDAGLAEARYVHAALPSLPFADGAFDLAVCSHFLFLYSQQFDEAFHLQSMRELCRVAREVRVFPLLALGTHPSPHVAPVMAAVNAEGFRAVIEAVPYEFQRGGNRMLRVTRSTG